MINVHVEPYILSKFVHIEQRRYVTTARSDYMSIWARVLVYVNITIYDGLGLSQELIK